MRVPKYLRHKSKYARVILNGREVHLGLYGSPESKENYERVVAEWLQNGRKTPRPKRLATIRKNPELTSEYDVLTITELGVKYYEFAQTYYLKAGKPTSELVGIQYVIRVLRKYYGESPIEQFGPTALKTLQAEFIKMKWARTTINKQIRRIVRMVRWGVSEGLVNPDILTGLTSVPGLKAGRSLAKEREKIKPVPAADVEALRPHISPVIMAMIDTQRLTGMRPSEVCLLRTCDLDRTGSVWEYRPPHHKTEHHGKVRVVYFGPQAQSVLKPWLRLTEPESYIFSPILSEEMRRAEMRKQRVSKVQPSQLDRSKPNPKRKPGEAYDKDSYRKAVFRGCALAGVKQWHPNQLRHLAATNLRREFGIEIARAVLGHSTVDMTEVYAEMDAAKARDAMAKSG